MKKDRNESRLFYYSKLEKLSKNLNVEKFYNFHLILLYLRNPGEYNKWLLIFPNMMFQQEK